MNERLRRIAKFERQLLVSLNNLNPLAVGEVARDVADGALNTISRVEGPEAASNFAFALADRITGDLLGAPTLAIPVASKKVDAKQSKNAVALASRVTWSQWQIAVVFWAGLACGVLLGWR